MSDFVVSARKYRPSTFKSVVGQDALTTTLRNAILQDKLSHAYLFCGPRGVGKTSCARIFAKTINCTNRTADGEACNECESCRSINEQKSYSVMELDAASNNSVNDIRTLIEQVYIAPSSSKYRVYIIDEVHMLSSSAFNAFLKTLEEPPRHAIFILATTEKHKVLPTIISRCQVHDFNRITSEHIANHLAYIAQQEGVVAEPEALKLIGISADGGMRDALSMFDQIAGYSNGRITLQSVRENLNLLDEEEYFKLLGYILIGNHAQVLTLVDQLLTRGYEGDIIMRGFSNFLRNVLLAQSRETLGLIEVPTSTLERMIKAGQYTPASMLWRFLKISSTFSSQYQSNSEKRLALEMALLSMCELSGQSALVGCETPPQGGGGDTRVGTSSPTAAPVQPTTSTSQPQPRTSPGTRYTSDTTTPIPQERDRAATSSRISNIQEAYSYRLRTGATPVQEASQLDKEAEQSAPQKELLNEPFTNEQVKEVWRKYRSEREISMFVKSTMQERIPQLKEGSGAELVLDLYSNTEEEQISVFLPSIISEMRKELRNDHIIIEVVRKRIEDSGIPITPREKYDFLVKHNPWIAKMANDLSLYPI